MRWLSTDDSVAAHEITLAATSECIAAIGVYVGIGLWLQSWTHYVAAIACAPLFLLRTERSFNQALHLYKTHTKSLVGSHGSLLAKPSLLYTAARTTVFILKMVLLAASAVLIRILVTAWCTLRHPSEAITALPRNWTRQALCTDFAAAPEVVPGENSASDQVPTFRDLLELYSDDDWRSGGVLYRSTTIVGTLPIILLMYLPAIFLRISFKAASVAYAPLVFLAHVTFNSRLSTKIRLEAITKGEWEKARRWLSVFILALLVAKLIIVLGLAPVADVLDANKGLPAQIISVQGWPGWQLILVFDAILTFVILGFCDAALRRLDGGSPWPDTVTRTVLSTVLFVRGVSAAYAVVALFALSANTLSQTLKVVFEARAPVVQPAASRPLVPASSP
jgi:hypothetical protein